MSDIESLFIHFQISSELCADVVIAIAVNIPISKQSKKPQAYAGGLNIVTKKALEPLREDIQAGCTNTSAFHSKNNDQH